MAVGTKRYLRALSHKDFTYLWFGQSVSQVGDGVFAISLVFETLRIGSGAKDLSVVLAARALPTVLLLLLAGAVVDRHHRRHILLASDLLRGLAVGGMALIAATPGAAVWELAAMSILFGVGDAFAMPAFTALVPDLVPGDALVEASALTGGSQLLGQSLIGPALGGVLIAVTGSPVAFGFDAATFVLSMVCVLRMGVEPLRSGARGTLRADMGDGVRYTLSKRWLWWSLLGIGLVNFAIFTPVGVVVPLMIKHSLHQGSAGLGLVMAAGGAGGGLATLAVGARGHGVRRPMRTMWTLWVCGAVALGVLGFVNGIWVAALLYSVAWVFVTAGALLWTPLIQSLVPAEMLGRVSSIDWLVSLALSPISYLAAGLLADAVGARTTLVIGGIVGALSGLVLLVPGVRDPDGNGGHQGPPGRNLSDVKVVGDMAVAGDMAVVGDMAVARNQPDYVSSESLDAGRAPTTSRASARWPDPSIRSTS